MPSGGATAPPAAGRRVRPITRAPPPAAVVPPPPVFPPHLAGPLHPPPPTLTPPPTSTPPRPGSLRLGGTATVRESPPDSVAGSGAVKGPRQGLSEVAKLSDDAPWAAPEGLAEEAGRVKELGTAPAPVLNFLKERGISRDVAEKCGVG